MNILDKIRKMFSRGEMPEEARSVIRDAKTTQEALAGLDSVLTKNEIEINKLKKEIDKVDGILQEEEGKIRDEKVQGRQKRYTLQYVKRLRGHLDNLENRMSIYDKNINLHIKLIGKIQDMEAMALRGVDEAQIDRIIMEFEDQVSKYMDVVHAGEAGFEASTNIADREDKDLARLEREIMGVEGAARDKENPKKETAENRREKDPPAKEPEPAGADDDEEEEEEEGDEDRRMLE